MESGHGRIMESEMFRCTGVSNPPSQVPSSLPPEEERFVACRGEVQGLAGRGHSHGHYVHTCQPNVHTCLLQREMNLELENCLFLSSFLFAAAEVPARCIMYRAEITMSMLNSA